MDNANECHLVFDFSNDEQHGQPLHFCNPVDIVTTDRVDEIVPALKRVQQAVDEGWYAAGYVSYEAAPAFDSHFPVHHGERRMPLMWFGLFREPCETDITYTEGSFHLSDWEPATTAHDYYSHIQSVQEAIQRGETNQVNYTMRFHSTFEGDDYAFYKRLSNQQPGYNAYLNLGRFRLLSASPELFFRQEGNELTMRPMKGTAERGRWTEEDREQAAWLVNSEKNRTENKIIVDLLQDELSVLSPNQTARVARSFDVERYPTVWQMTSTVTTETGSDGTIDEIFTQLFPCGSITGSPKTSTMQLIADLEDSPREVYCGAIGYMKPGGESVFNVPIRTVMVDSEKGLAQYGAGGGITSESIPEEEYDEAFMKTKVLTYNHPDFELLESLRLENGHYFLLERHLQRLEKSGEYFNFSIDREHITEKLDAYSQRHDDGLYKVRLLIAKNGNVTIEGTLIDPMEESKPVTIATSPMQKEDPFLYHKTTNRHMYEIHRPEDPTVFDVLLWNENGELTEFMIGNLVLEWDGTYYTPPIESGLLPGTYRAELLATNQVTEHILTHRDLESCTRIWMVNSVRGWIPVYVR